MENTSRGKASADLTIDGEETVLSATAESDAHASGRFQAVINAHACNLHQIEAAIVANQHSTDPHPISPGQTVSRHPVLIACFDPSQADADGRPLPGAPLELDIDTIRKLYSERFAYVSADPPPYDG